MMMMMRYTRDSIVHDVVGEKFPRLCPGVSRCYNIMQIGIYCLRVYTVYYTTCARVCVYYT